VDDSLGRAGAVRTIRCKGGKSRKGGGGVGGWEASNERTETHKRQRFTVTDGGNLKGVVFGQTTKKGEGPDKKGDC